MAKYTQKITIDKLTEKQKDSDNDALLGGRFCLDVTSDLLPISLEKMTNEERTSPNLRLLDTHATLTAIETIFQSAASSVGNDVYSLEIQLLKKVIPHLNNSYERQYDRFASDDGVHVTLVKDLADIHIALNTDSADIGNKWTVHNRGLGGMMVSTKDIAYSQLDVGDFYAVIDENNSPLLANVRWLHVVDTKTVEMGLELLRGEPVTINYYLENEPKQLSALLLRNKKQADTLIASKGLLEIDQAIELTEDDKTYIISIDTLIDNSFNYDQFSFTVI